LAASSVGLNDGEPSILAENLTSDFSLMQFFPKCLVHVFQEINKNIDDESRKIICLETCQIFSALSSECNHHYIAKYFIDHASSTVFDNPVASAFHVLTEGGKVTCSHLCKSKLIEVLKDISAIHQSRQYFFEALPRRMTGIRILLAVSKSFISFTENDRINSLKALCYCCLPDATNITPRKEAIFADGGMEIIADLMESRDTREWTWDIKFWASHLFVAAMTCDKNNHALVNNSKIVESLQNQVAYTVERKSWFACDGDILSCERRGMFISNLMRILAEILCDHHKWNDRFLQALMRCLPEPQTDSDGVVTAHSVCLPLIEQPESSPHSFASASKSFQGNILCIMIRRFLLDIACPILCDQKLLEKLVHILANHSKYHPSVSKNAASLAARILTSSKSKQLEDHFRLLKGTEMIVTLEREGVLK